MIHVAHDGDHGGPFDQVFLLFGDLNFLLRFLFVSNGASGSSELAGHLGRQLGIQRLVDGGEDVAVHQFLDDHAGLDIQLFGKFLDRDTFRDGDLTADRRRPGGSLAARGRAQNPFFRFRAAIALRTAALIAGAALLIGRRRRDGGFHAGTARCGMHRTRPAAWAHGSAWADTRTRALPGDHGLARTERSTVDGLSRRRSALRPRNARADGTAGRGRRGHAGRSGAGLAQSGCQVRTRRHHGTRGRLSGKRSRRRSGRGVNRSAGCRGSGRASRRCGRDWSARSHTGSGENRRRRRDGFVDAWRHRLARSGQHLAGPRRRNRSGHGRHWTAGRNRSGRWRGRGCHTRGDSCRRLRARRRTARQWRTNGERWAGCRTIRRGFRGGRLRSHLFHRGGGRWLAQWATRHNFQGRRCLDCRDRVFGRCCGARFRFPVLRGDDPAEQPPQFDGDIFVDRAGVGLLFGYAQLRQPVQDLVRLNLELPSQLVNTNLVHRYKTVSRRRTSLALRTAVFRLVVRNAPRVYYGIRLASDLNVLRLGGFDGGCGFSARLRLNFCLWHRRAFRDKFLNGFRFVGRGGLSRCRLAAGDPDFGFDFSLIKRRRRRGFFKLRVVSRHRIPNVLHHLRIDARDLLQLLRRHAAQLIDDAHAGLRQSSGQFFNQAVCDQCGHRLRRIDQGGHGGLHLLALLLFALDVHLPPKQLGRQADVLALFADGQRELRIVHDHFHVLFERVDDGHAADLRRAQCVRGERHRILRVFDDVDLFAAQLADDGLHAHAFHAHASAHAIHVAVAALHRDLGALAGVPRAPLDGHGAVVNLRNFLLEQAHHQLRGGARHQHPRTLAGFVHHADDAAHAVAHAVTLQAGLLLLRQARLRLAQIQNVIGTFHPLHGAVHQFAGAAGVLVKDRFALGLAHLLENHLLGGLRRDTAEQVGLFRNADLGADLGFRIDAARLGQRHFLGRVFHHLDRLLDGEKLEGPGLLVQLGDIVFRVAEVLARGDQHGVLDGVQYDLRINALFLAQYLDGLKNRFQSVPLLFCPWIVNPMARRGLPLKLQVRLFYLFEREADLPASGFQADDAIGEARQGTLPLALVFDRRAQGDLGLLPLEPLVIARLEQLAFEARRADFQRVMAGHHVLDVENGTDLVRDQLAIGVRYALGLVDRNAHKLVFPAAFDFHFDHFNAFGEGHALRDLLDAL